MSKCGLAKIMKFIDDSIYNTDYPYYCAYGTLIRTNFERFKVNIPNNYDELSRHSYGDYMIAKKEDYLS